MTNRMKKVFAFLAFALVVYFSLIMIAKADEITPEQQYRTAVEYWQSEEYSGLAIEMWKDLAITNEHLPSIWALVFVYIQGTVVERDVSKSIKWLTKLSDLGQPDAKEMLGDMYYYGRGVPQDYAMAFKWYSNYIEVEQDVDILMRYATLIATGQGTTKNLTEAWKVLHIASDDDRYKMSTYLLASMIFEQMSPFEQFQIQFFMNQRQNRQSN